MIFLWSFCYCVFLLCKSGTFIWRRHVHELMTNEGDGMDIYLCSFNQLSEFWQNVSKRVNEDMIFFWGGWIGVGTAMFLLNNDLWRKHSFLVITVHCCNCKVEQTGLVQTCWWTLHDIIGWMSWKNTVLAAHIE